MGRGGVGVGTERASINADGNAVVSREFGLVTLEQAARRSECH